MSLYPFSLASLFVVLFLGLIAPRTGFAAGGVYDRLEASFELPSVTGNPFDFTQNDVRVTWSRPDGQTTTVPAFFDGDRVWRVRYRPDQGGVYVVREVSVNGQLVEPQKLMPREFLAEGNPKPGFIRLDPADRMRFVRDDGSPYYPVGYNLGWRSRDFPPLAESLAKMGAAGVNWSRIWMCHWDGKNLDWSNGRSQVEAGSIDLESARLWDEIVHAAEAHRVPFQLVLQHHGQYSSTTNTNWGENPWNVANGGWLEKPEQFFADERAKTLTRNKYRYIIARYGHSPAIMAWELFNEVEYTDGFRNDTPSVAAWHAEMAAFLREQDPYGHLVTTSSRVAEASLWSAMDYYQAHVYPSDVVTAVTSLDDRELDRAYFYGEIGSSTSSWREERGQTLHQALWSSLVSGASGAAQYWYWDNVEPNNLFFHYTAAQGFIEASRQLQQEGLKTVAVTVDTPNRGPFRFGPGKGWAEADTTEFTVHGSGMVEGLSGMSEFLQGDNNRAMFPSATFHVDFATDGTFGVRFRQASKNGAKLVMTLDGAAVAELDVPPAEDDTRLDRLIEIPISTGKHTLRLENTGQDWFLIEEFVLTPYTSELAALGKSNRDLTLLWVYRRNGGGQPVAGTVTVPGALDGDYRVTWWDTTKGEVIGEATTAAAGGSLQLSTPAIEQDVAGWIARVR